MRKIKASFLLLAAFATPVSTFAPAVSVKDAYDYRESVFSVKPENRATYAGSASLTDVPKVISGFETEGAVSL